MAVSSVSAGLVKASPEKYVLVNVLEPEEDFEDGAQLPTGTVKMSVGKLLSLTHTNKVDTADWYQKDKTIVTICNTGKRAEIAARELAKYGDVLPVFVLSARSVTSAWSYAIPDTDPARALSATATTPRSSRVE